VDDLTFGLAFAAYALLAADVAARSWGMRIRSLTIVVAVVLIAHVALVWGHRFGGSADAALANGWTGFLIFHGAFAAILAATVAREPWATRFLAVAFPVASVGAIGAAFKYDYVAGLRWPLVGVAGATVVLAGIGWRKSTRAAGA
jgi:hypothetical protein